MDTPFCDLWTDGIICAFEFDRVADKWVAIGWTQILELVQIGQCSSQQIDLMDDEDERPIWWCHTDAHHPSVVAWLSDLNWLHPTIGFSLRDESELRNEHMKYLKYEVPVRVEGGLFFQLLGQLCGDSLFNVDDTSFVIRSWQTQKFLVTTMHVKASTSNFDVPGVTEVQKLLLADGNAALKSVHEIIAHLAYNISLHDNRLFREYVFDSIDAAELDFMNRRSHEEDLTALNKTIKRLAAQNFKVKRLIRAQDEIVFELLQHLRGDTTRSLLEEIRNNTKEMLEEHDVIHKRLFNMQVPVRSNDKSRRFNHNLRIISCVGVVLLIIVRLFGINVGGIPGAQNTPYAFALFCGLLLLFGAILLLLALHYFGLRNPTNDDQHGNSTHQTRRHSQHPQLHHP